VPCRGCPLADPCLGKNAKTKTIKIAQDEEHLQAGRAMLADPDTAEHLRRTRPRIQRLLGLVAHRYHARQSRYIGTSKSTLQAAWPAAVLNLGPIAQRLPA
jgi:hypothetical protein